jgi:hypothetical protein
MTIVLDKDQGILMEDDEQIGLECPYCNVFAHLSPQAVPQAADLLRDRPKRVGLVYQCDACQAPIFLRFATRETQGTLLVLVPAETYGDHVPRGAVLLFRG